MGFIGPVVGALGWSLLLCRRCPEGTPAINYRICAGELSRALAAASALVIRPKTPSTVQEWMPFFVMGLVNNVVPFYFQFVALTIITVGLISIIEVVPHCWTVWQRS